MDKIKFEYKILVAYDSKQGIGKGLHIPWYLPEDLKRFRELTLNQTVIMGSLTFKSILEKLGKPLPKRKNIVLSRKMKTIEYEDCELFHDIEAVLEKYQDAWIIGGEQIYRLFLPYVSEIYATALDKDWQCDIFFPGINFRDWEEISNERQNGFRYINYRRKS